MHRSRASLAVVSALVAWGVAAGGARAQTGTIGVNVLDFTGRRPSEFSLPDLASTAAHPIGANECDAVITFRFTNVDVMRAQLLFFEGSMCDDPAMRTDTTTTTCQQLDIDPVATNMRSQVDVSVHARDLVPCDGSGSGVETIWVLAVNNRNDTVSGNGQSVSFPIAFDLTAPSRVTGLRAMGGEDAATLRWDAASGVDEYEIFADPTGCSGGTVTSPGLTTDPPDESLIVATPQGTATSYTLPFPDGVPIPGQMAVAVRGKDSSGNVGDLSNVICVDRFEVTSWWETYCAETGHEACTSSGCAAAPASSGGGAFALVLGIAGLALLRRRAR